MGSHGRKVSVTFFHGSLNHLQLHFFQCGDGSFGRRRAGFTGKVKMFVIQYSIFVNDDSLLNSVLQFPNIPIPRMLAQLVLCRRGKNDISFVILLTETVDKPFGKGDNIFFSVT